MDNCVFCKIVGKENDEEIIYENENIIVFPDMRPMAPTHLLITPKEHYNDYSEMIEKNPEMVREIGVLVETLIVKLKLEKEPFTWGFHGGGKQSVDHVHAQLLFGMGDKYVL